MKRNKSKMEGSWWRKVKNGPRIETCKICSKKMPELTEDGKHNFAPHIINGKVENLCIECKVSMPHKNRQL